MAANAVVKCPTEDCNFMAAVRILGGDEDDVNLAMHELKDEHPNHEATKWKFIEERLKENES